jgi:hypothetical protein
MMEDFPSIGHPPLDVCCDKVTQADVLVAIVAHRYGWIPPGQPANQFKSITWLECEEAVRQGKEVLVFLDHSSLIIYTIVISSILYFQRNTTGASLISSKY